MHCIYFPPEVGGLESHVYHLCRELVARGHQVSVVTSRSMAGVPTRERMHGIDIIRTWFPSRNPMGWALHSLLSLPATLSAARDVDVIHAQAFASVPPAAVARRSSGAPLVATFHTSHFLRKARKPLWRGILGALVRAPDRCLATSVEIRDVAESLAPGKVVEALTNGVETSLFRKVTPSLQPSGGLRLIVPRRLFPKNGVEFFVRAMPEILQSRADVEAVLVGDGPERNKLEGLASDLGVGDRVRFLGSRSHAEMPGLLSSADVAVFPSLMEATSVAALEAMACELPVAASRVGGLPEIVDESTGALFDPADPHDLARTVLALLERPDRVELGRSARERVVSRWSNARLVDRHLEVYASLVSKAADT